MRPEPLFSLDWGVTKKLYQELIDAHKAVEQVYPGACYEGVGITYSWTIKMDNGEGIVVAEAWMHKWKNSLWLCIKPCNK